MHLLWCAKMLETRLEVVKTARKNARKFWLGKGSKNATNIGSDIVGTCRPRYLGALGVGFGEHTSVAFSKILSNMSSNFYPIFTFYVVCLKGHVQQESGQHLSLW